MVPEDVGGVVVGVVATELTLPVPQPLEAVTETVPAPLPAVTTIEVVPWPEVIVQPVGTVQV